MKSKKIYLWVAATVFAATAAPAQIAAGQPDEAVAAQAVCTSPDSPGAEQTETSSPAPEVEVCPPETEAPAPGVAVVVRKDMPGGSRLHMADAEQTERITAALEGREAGLAAVNRTPRFAFGVQLGVDVGGAVPWPPANLRADVMKMRAVPRLSPSIGLSFTANLPKRFSLTAEVVGKQIGIDAEAWVSGQQFRMPDPGGPDMITRFRGTAEVTMRFSMIEVPVYVGYGFNEGRSRIYLGAYYSYVFHSNFDTTPIKGLVENPLDPSTPPILVTPENPVPKDVMPVFNDYLGNWDAGMLLGYEWQIIPRLSMTARFSVGFKDIFRRGSNYLEYKMLHMRGSLSISYAFLRFNDSPFKRDR